MSKQLQVFEGVVALVKRALPDAGVRAMETEDAKPSSIDPGGTVVVREGDPGEPDIDLSPLTYNYVHVFPIEVAAYEAAGLNPRQVIDRMLVAIGEEVDVDRTLGGLCDFLEARAATTDDLTTMGGQVGRWADAAIVAAYATSNPLN